MAAQKGSTALTEGAPRSEPTWRPGKRKAGRPSRLTSAIEAKFMQALRAGSSYADASRFVGLNPLTVDGWRRRGRGVHALPATPEFVRFVRLCDEARASVKVQLTGNLLQRSRVDHHAALAFLRHLDPEWRDDPLVNEDNTTGSHGQVVSIDNRQEMNVLVLTPGEIPDFVHDLLEQRRAIVAAQPVEEMEPTIPIRVNDGPRTRLSALRVDSGAVPDSE